MGWIHKRYMKTGHGLNKGNGASYRQKSPLRNIVEFVRAGDNSLFGREDKLSN